MKRTSIIVCGLLGALVMFHVIIEVRAKSAVKEIERVSTVIRCAVDHNGEPCSWETSTGPTPWPVTVVKSYTNPIISLAQLTALEKRVEELEAWQARTELVENPYYDGTHEKLPKGHLMYIVPTFENTKWVTRRSIKEYEDNCLTKNPYYGQDLFPGKPQTKDPESPYTFYKREYVTPEALEGHREWLAKDFD